MFNSTSIFSPSPGVLPSDFEVSARRVPAFRLRTCGGFLPFTKRAWAAKRLLRQDCASKTDFMSDCGRWQRAMWSQKQTFEWTSSKPLRLVHLDGQAHFSKTMTIYPDIPIPQSQIRQSKPTSWYACRILSYSQTALVTTTDLQRPTDHTSFFSGSCVCIPLLANFVS